MAYFPLDSDSVSSDIQPESDSDLPLLSPWSTPAPALVPHFRPSELESLVLAASEAASNPCDQRKLDLEGMKTDLTAAMDILRAAKAKPVKGRRKPITAGRKGLLAVVERGMAMLGEAVVSFRGKCEWVSAQPLPMVTTSQSSQASKHAKKVRAVLSPTTTPCQCILAASKRLKTQEFREALQSGAIICTCKAKRA